MSAAWGRSQRHGGVCVGAAPAYRRRGRGVTDTHVYVVCLLRRRTFHRSTLRGLYILLVAKLYILLVAKRSTKQNPHATL